MILIKSEMIISVNVCYVFSLVFLDYSFLEDHEATNITKASKEMPHQRVNT